QQEAPAPTQPAPTSPPATTPQVAPPLVAVGYRQPAQSAALAPAPQRQLATQPDAAMTPHTSADPAIAPRPAAPQRTPVTQPSQAHLITRMPQVATPPTSGTRVSSADAPKLDATTSQQAASDAAALLPTQSPSQAQASPPTVPVAPRVATSV